MYQPGTNIVRTASIRLLLVTAFGVLVACGGGSNTSNITPPPATNTPPVVNAGADQTVSELTVVQLTGTASDVDNDPLTYAWTQLAGTAVILNTANMAMVNFTATDVAAGAAEDLTFRLTVSDGAGGTSTDDVVITVQEPAPVVVLSGTARYEFPPPNAACDGLNFSLNAIIQLPIRGAPVEILDPTGAVLIASTTTDPGGFYSVTVDANIDVKIRVRSELQRAGVPGWEVAVRNNTANIGVPLDQRPIYLLDTTPFTTGGVDLTRDVLAGTGWGSTSFTGVRAAAPFAVMDAIYEMMQLIVAANPSVVFPRLDAFWSPDNNSSAGTGDFFADIDTGDIGTSFYLGSLNSLFLLGQDGDDIEEFDEHVIAHEWGHYFENNFSRSDSIGGSHGLGDQLDKRVAFGEGFATALAGIGLADPMYCDTLWSGGTLRGFEIDLESEPAGFTGWFNEVSVLKFIFDLWDSNDEGGDAMSIGFTPIYNVMIGPQRTTPAFTSIFSFAEALKAQPNAETAFINAQLGRENITGAGINLYGIGESNDGPGSPPDVLPLYTDIAVGVTERICSNSQFDIGRTGNKLSEARYLRLDLQISATLTVTVDTVNPTTTPSAGFNCNTAPASDPEISAHSDPDIEVWRDGQLFIQGLSCTPNQEITVPQFLAAGLYVMDLTEFRYADGNTSGGFPEQTCFDVTVAP